MSEFPYHTTAAIARGGRVSIEELRNLSCLAKAYYDKWRHNDRQRIDDLSRITALEAECALLKAALLEAEGRLHEVAVACATAEQKLAASEARVVVLEKSLRHYGTHSDHCEKSRFVNPSVCTCGYDAALSQPGKGE